VKYRHLWKRAGGIFVLHRTAEQTIEELAELGLPVRHENLSRTPEPGP
jgi:hypothetical protein